MAEGIKEGNILWYYNATNPEINLEYPVVGELYHFKELYKIVEVIVGDEKQYWLDKGIRIVDYFVDELDGELYSILMRMFRRGSTVEGKSLGDKFEGSLISTGAYKGFIPDECELPIPSDIKLLQDAVTTYDTHDKVLGKALNFRRDNMSNIYDDIDDRIFWTSYYANKSRKRINTFITDRIKVKYTQFSVTPGNYLWMNLTDTTAYYKFGYGAWFTSGDWTSVAGYNRRLFWAHNHYPNEVLSYNQNESLKHFVTRVDNTYISGYQGYMTADNYWWNALAVILGWVAIDALWVADTSKFLNLRWDPAWPTKFFTTRYWTQDYTGWIQFIFPNISVGGATLLFLAVIIIVGGFEIAKAHWGELRLKLKAEFTPPGIEPKPKETPDPIFFGSGY